MEDLTRDWRWIMSQQAYEALHPSVTPQDVEKFSRFLVGHGCTEWEAEILLLHFVDNKSFREITAMDGYTSLQATYTIYKRAVEKVKRSILYEREQKERIPDEQAP